MRWPAGPVAIGLIVVGTLPARTQFVSYSYPENSDAALLLRGGGQVVASTASTVFIRAADDRLFECVVVGDNTTLNLMFKPSIKFNGLQAKLISACSELEPRLRELSLFALALWAQRGGI